MTDPGRHLSSADEVLPRSGGTRPGPCTGAPPLAGVGASGGRGGLDACLQSALALEGADVCGGAAALQRTVVGTATPGQPLAGEVAPSVRVVTLPAEWGG